MPVKIKAVCPDCGHDEFVTTSWEYACAKCGRGIGDDMECFPLRFIETSKTPQLDKMRARKIQLDSTERMPRI